ncbi:MAG: DegT/DnrJ/EryC1/StrS family aminotransferase [Syntrophomonadaceae bacterium]|nr:DegT/DnrJ/EryC1/StrS family aminotransferase [Syntrophomonadaceae bacterium]
MLKFLPFALPDIGEDEINEVVDSLRSGWLTTGPKTKRFEEEFAQFIGSGVQAIAVNSATAGLHLALEAIGIKAGDEVITSTYTFTTTAEVIRYLGADPVFIDVNPLTLNLDVSQIRSAITGRTKAIIPVHFAGLACDMQQIIRIASEYNIHVIEDAAHALPTTCNHKLIGSLETDAAVFSFYATKTLATGEGGMIVTRNKEIAQRCRVMRLHGINRDAFDRYTSKKPSWYYEVIAPGFKYNMTDLAASLGIHQLIKLNTMRIKRENIIREYDEAFKNLPLILPAHAKNHDQHAWHLYVIRLKDEAKINRDDFIAGMFSFGIGCSVHFIPLHMQPYWRDTYSLKPGNFPCAYDAYCRAVSLPIYSRMSDNDQEQVIQAVTELLR